MAKIIDDETIENVCILAKLSLSDEAKEKAKEDMQKMLDYVEKLDELDTDGVEPLSHIFGDQNVFREDTGPISSRTKTYFVRMLSQTETTKKQCLQMHQKQKKDSIRYRRLSDNEREFI